MKTLVKIKYLGLILAGFLFLASCNQGELKEEVQQLSEENEKLRAEGEQKEAHLTEFFESMNQIRENLREIKSRQNLISEETKEQDMMGVDAHAQIETDLEAIGNLMEDNRKRIIHLTRQLRESNIHTEEMRNLVATLQDEIEKKAIELSLMQNTLQDLNIQNEALAATIDVLEKENAEKTKELTQLEKKTDQLNTVWLVFGTKSELMEHNIISREGGFLGLGRTTVVNSNLSEEYLTQLNMSENGKVQLPGMSPELISAHPEDSYIIEILDEENTQLTIENPQKFWSASRYLVVSVE